MSIWKVLSISVAIHHSWSKSNRLVLSVFSLECVIKIFDEYLPQRSSSNIFLKYLNYACKIIVIPQTNSHSKLLLFSDSLLVVYNKCNITSTKYTLLKINITSSIYTFLATVDSFEKLFKQLELVSHQDIQTLENN